MKPGCLDSERTCPVCGKSDEVIEIVYGMPTESTFRRAQKGKIRLGGCCIDMGSPHYYCKRDDKEFGYTGGLSEEI